MAGSLAPFVAPGAQLDGDVRLGEASSIWFGAEIRGIEAHVEVGAETNVQDNCVVEGRPNRPAILGPRVTLGHNARVFGATVEARSMIAIGATVLPGAVIGTQSIIAANATVPENMQVPPRSLVIGQGRIVREVTEAEITRVERGATGYVNLGREYARGQAGARAAD